METHQHSKTQSTSKLERRYGFSFAVRTDVGMRRDENQDAYSLAQTSETSLFIVTDGMGGASGGARASFVAANLLARLAIDSSGNITPSSFSTAINKTNEFIYNESQTDEGLAGMGTTLVMVGFSGNRALVANVGDSRIYLKRDKNLLRLTKDHTLVQQLVELGEISLEQAESHPMAHMLTRSLGPMDHIQADIGYLDFEVEEGDSFVLCCDGLYNHVADFEIAEIVDRYSPGEAAEELVKLANSRGGSDNITVEVVVANNLSDVPKSCKFPSKKNQIEIASSGESKKFKVPGMKHAYKEVIVKLYDKFTSSVDSENVTSKPQANTNGSVEKMKSAEMKPSIMTDGTSAFDSIILGHTPKEETKKMVIEESSKTDESISEFIVVQEIPVSNFTEKQLALGSSLEFDETVSSLGTSKDSKVEAKNTESISKSLEKEEIEIPKTKVPNIEKELGLKKELSEESLDSEVKKDLVEISKKEVKPDLTQKKDIKENLKVEAKKDVKEVPQAEAKRGLTKGGKELLNKKDLETTENHGIASEFSKKTESKSLSLNEKKKNEVDVPEKREQSNLSASSILEELPVNNKESKPPKLIKEKPSLTHRSSKKSTSKKSKRQSVKDENLNVQDINYLESYSESFPDQNSSKVGYATNIIGVFAIFAGLAGGGYYLKDNPVLLSKIQGLSNSNWFADEASPKENKKQTQPDRVVGNNTLPAEIKKTSSPALINKPNLEKLEPKKSESRKASSSSVKKDKSSVTAKKELILKSESNPRTNSFKGGTPGAGIALPEEKIIKLKENIKKDASNEIVDGLSSKKSLSSKVDTIALTMDKDDPLLKIFKENKNDGQPEKDSAALRLPVENEITNTEIIKENKTTKLLDPKISNDIRKISLKKNRVRDEIDVIDGKLHSYKVVSPQELLKKQESIKEQISIVGQSAKDTDRDLVGLKKNYTSLISQSVELKKGNVSSVARSVARRNPGVKQLYEDWQKLALEYGNTSDANMLDSRNSAKMRELGREVKLKKISLGKLLSESLDYELKSVVNDISENGIMLENLKKRKKLLTRQVAIAKSSEGLSAGKRKKEEERLLNRRESLMRQLTALNQKLPDSEEEKMRRDKILRSHGIK